MTSKEFSAATTAEEGVQGDTEEAVNLEETTGCKEHSSIAGEEWPTGTTLPLNS